MLEPRQSISEPSDGFRTSRDALAWAKPKLPRRESATAGLEIAALGAAVAGLAAAPLEATWAVGASGTVAALLSGGIDSPVAAWRMMKRWCRVLFAHFHSVPYLPATSQAKARALVERAVSPTAKRGRARTSSRRAPRRRGAPRAPAALQKMLRLESLPGLVPRSGSTSRAWRNSR